MSDLVGRSKARMLELSALIDKHSAEFKELDTFVKQAEKIERKLTDSSCDGSIPDQPIGASTNRNRKGHAIYRAPLKPQTGKLLDQIFTKHSKLHLDQVLDQLLALGYRGSGDRKRDYRSVHALLTGKTELYRNLGRAVFERIPNLDGKGIARGKKKRPNSVHLNEGA